MTNRYDMSKIFIIYINKIDEDKIRKEKVIYPCDTKLHTST
jgi:hypothetical protein